MGSQSWKRNREERPELPPNAYWYKKKKKKHTSKDREAEPKELNAKHPELLPKPVPTSPKDPDLKVKEEKKSMPKREGAESNKLNAERPELCLKPDSIPPKVPDCQLLLKPESTPPKDPDQKKKKSLLKLEGAELNELNADHLELCPKPDPLSTKDSDPELIPKPEPTPHKDPDQKKTNKRKRKKKKKSLLDREGAESNGPNAENPELYHKPDAKLPKDPDPELIRKSEPAPSKDPEPELLPKSEPTSPKDPNQKKKKKKKRKKSVPIIEGAESNELNAKLPLRRSKRIRLREERLRAERLRAERLGIIIKPLEPARKRCLACQQLGHGVRNCLRLKDLIKDKQVCFFCGEIGHSLGKCPESPGVARFANCLTCKERGHLSKNCPQNAHGIDSKAVAASEPIKTYDSQNGGSQPCRLLEFNRNTRRTHKFKERRINPKKRGPKVNFF